MNRVLFQQPMRRVMYGTLRRQQQRNFNSKNMPREAGFGKVIIFLTPIAVVGGVISYAKYDKEFRKLVEANVPGSSAILKVALQEEKPFQEISKKFESVSEQVSSVASSISGLIGKSEDKPAEKVEKKSSPISKPAADPKETKQPSAAPIKAELPITKPKETLPSDVLGLEKEIELAASLAVQEYNKAINVLNSYNTDVRNVVDKAIEEVDPTSWITLKNKTSARDSSVEHAEKLAREALQKFEKCKLALARVSTESNNEEVQEVRNKIKKLNEHINKVKDELYKSKDISSLSEKYWKKVEASRNYFLTQIESIFPGLDLAEKKLNISKEDFDLFILHAYSHVLAYQKELQRLQTDGELRLKRAIEASRGEDQSAATKAQLDFHMEKEKRKIAIENQNKILKIRAESKKELRNQLKMQAEAHVEHLNDIVAIKEAELKRKYDRELEEKLEKEKAAYKLELAAMLGKLGGIDAALKARAESELSAHQAQALWAACQALWATVRTGDPGVHWKNKLRPLKSEISAVYKVSEGDELVNVVLQNLSKTAENRGVFPEDALRERFLNVEHVARKVALVPEEGARLPIYLLSYLQSLFILRPYQAISKEELEDKQIDFSKLDTYDILNRARYFVDRGDLMQALKYMNLLQGAPRKVASDWIVETRLLLETQQAANTLMAHAAASGLLYL